MTENRQPPGNETPDEWLTLREACQVLGVHPTTLRTWADKGQITTFRTPGGHRRFAASDLRRFVEVGRNLSPPTEDAAQELLVNALTATRHEMATRGSQLPALHDQFDEAARAHKRASGRELLGLAIRYAVYRRNRGQVLAEAQEIGLAYGMDAAQRGLTAADVARLVCLFRSALLKTAIQSPADTGQATAFRDALEHFMDEVLFAMLAGHEDA